MHLSGNVIISEGHLQWSRIFKGTVWVSLEEALAVIPFFKSIELISMSVAAAHSMNDPFLHYKKQFQPHFL